mgnify:CR=1 FL=1
MKVLERRSIRRVPVVLPAVAGIEMWERFSFYGMQAILAYYLYSTSDGLGMEQTQATALVGAYGSLLYLFTFVGGWVSDHAVMDRQLGTMHVFTGVEIKAIPPARARALRALAG